MEYAVVKINNQQFKVAKGDIIDIAKTPGKKGKKVTFDKVLLFYSPKKIDIGQPYLSQYEIEAEIVDQYKAPKVRVATYKAKSKYRRVIGHRQPKTKIKIIKIKSPKSKKTTSKK